MEQTYCSFAVDIKDSLPMVLVIIFSACVNYTIDDHTGAQNRAQSKGPRPCLVSFINLVSFNSSPDSESLQPSDSCWIKYPVSIILLPSSPLTITPLVSLSLAKVKAWYQVTQTGCFSDLSKCHAMHQLHCDKLTGTCLQLTQSFHVTRGCYSSLYLTFF